MKIVFAGPSVHGLDLSAFQGISFRAPATKGDIIKAVSDGARMIGLIDGIFEQQSSIWHKEILLALSIGIPVLGAASMGALRAAECAAFGMIGIGEVFELYASGKLENDAEVAQAHAPKELGYLPVSEAMVNVRVTIDTLKSKGLLPEHEASALQKSAFDLFFKERTWKAIVSQADLSAGRKSELSELIKSSSVNIKQKDALRLIEKIDQETCLRPMTTDWQLAVTPFLRL